MFTTFSAACLLLAPACNDGSGNETDGTDPTTGETAPSTTDPDPTADPTADPGTTTGPSDDSTSDPGTTGDPDTTGDPTDGGLTDDDPTNDVYELAIRRLVPGQDLTEFEEARDAFVELLTQEPGVGTDREFEAVVDFFTFMPPQIPVFIGMTQYDNIDAFMAAGDTLGDTAEAGAFFSTFTPEAFTPLVPLEAGTPVDLAAIANQEGNLLEVAVRDLSTYPDLVMADYEQARDDFLELLAQQPGFVAEFQWVSAIDPNIAVGMTVYQDMDAFMTIAGDLSVTPEWAAFLGGYPFVVGYANSVVK